MALRGACLSMWLAVALVGVAAAHAGGSAAVPPPSGIETLCVLDFDRLGDDPSLDWLERGLADMMIGTMNRLSPYRVVERKHLRGA